MTYEAHEIQHHDTLGQFVIDRSGHTCVYAGLYPDGETWRENLPVEGWAVRVRHWRDGTPDETEIVPLVLHMGCPVGLVPADEAIEEELCLSVLPPQPTADDQKDVESAITRHLTHLKRRAV